MQDATNNEDHMQNLGTIYGVSEIQGNSKDGLSCPPVLVSEKALIFFSWDDTANP